MITIDPVPVEKLNISTEEIKNLKDIKFYDPKAEPFRIYGLHEPLTSAPYHRIPTAVAKATSDGVNGLNFQTAGGRVRFVTTSNYIAIKVFNPSGSNMVNMCHIGSSSFDIYVNKNGRDTFAGVLKVPGVYKDSFEAFANLPAGRKELTINFPLYCGVQSFYIGLDSTSSLERREDYKFEQPILYYGSSITQGGCASRPGMAYESLISRRFDTNYINLGFSGNAKGEDAIANYMASLDFSVFVCDYDHNAPNVEHLESTHEKLYKTIRSAHPDVPVIFVTKPDCDPINSDITARRNVVYSTYNNARLRGEKVIFVDGYSLFAGELREECTVDGCHPNDLGMSRMADVIGKAVEYALNWR